MKLTLPVIGQIWINNLGDKFEIADINNNFIKRKWSAAGRHGKINITDFPFFLWKKI